MSVMDPKAKKNGCKRVFAKGTIGVEIGDAVNAWENEEEEANVGEDPSHSSVSSHTGPETRLGVATTTTFSISRLPGVLGTKPLHMVANRSQPV